MKRKYEILVLLKPNLNDKMIGSVLSEIEKKLDGEIVKKEVIGTKKLAYEIKKEKEAYYVLYYINVEPENIDIAKKSMIINKNILRQMILVHDKKWPFEMKTTKDMVFVDRKNKKIKKELQK